MFLRCPRLTFSPYPLIIRLFYWHQALEKLQNFGAPPDLDSAAKHLVAAQGELRRVRESAGLGAHDAVIAAAFDAGVNRRQMAPTPPRSMPVCASVANRCSL